MVSLLALVRATRRSVGRGLIGLALLIGLRTLVNGVVSIGIGLNIRRYAA